LEYLRQSDPKRKIVIRQLLPESANDLISAGFPFGDKELFLSLRYNFMKAFRFLPNSTRLIAYHTEEKRTIGFLCIMEDNPKIYSIKYVFIDPHYRRMGIASQMLDSAILLAKNNGAKKIYLDVEQEKTAVVELYKKFNFKILQSRLVGKGYLSKNSRLRVISQTLLGQGYLAGLKHKNGPLISFQHYSNSAGELLFDVCSRCMNNNFIDFFQIDSHNSLNGYTQLNQPFVIKDVLIDSSAKSYALVFNAPLFSNATVEVGCISEKAMSYTFDDLFKFLSKKGMSYVNLTVFNVNDVKWSNWFGNNEYQSLRFLVMGRSV